MRITVRQLKQLIREQVEEAMYTMQQKSDEGQFDDWTVEAGAHLEDFLTRDDIDPEIKTWVENNIAGAGRIGSDGRRKQSETPLFRNRNGRVRSPRVIKTAWQTAPRHIKSNTDVERLIDDLLSSSEIELSAAAEERAKRRRADTGRSTEGGASGGVRGGQRFSQRQADFYRRQGGGGGYGGGGMQPW